MSELCLWVPPSRHAVTHWKIDLDLYFVDKNRLEYAAMTAWLSSVARRFQGICPDGRGDAGNDPSAGRCAARLPGWRTGARSGSTSTGKTQRLRQLSRRWLWAVALLSMGARGELDLDGGMKAFETGDYAAAYEAFRPLAAYHGYEQAMNQLGVMYEHGLGIERDGAQAVAWYEKAALRGHSKAMYNLGMLYAEGTVLPRDLVKGLAWIGAASDHREDDAVMAAKTLVARMSDEQIAAAKKLREQINVRIYAHPAEAPAAASQPALTAPPLAQSRLLNNEQIIDLFSGNTSTHEFRESPMREHFQAHSSRKHALAGRKARFKGEYRDGYYKGKWWVEGDMLCLNYAKIEEFDDCFWLERLSDVEVRSYSRKTGATVIERIEHRR